MPDGKINLTWNHCYCKAACPPWLLTHPYTAVHAELLFRATPTSPWPFPASNITASILQLTVFHRSTSAGKQVLTHSSAQLLLLLTLPPKTKALFQKVPLWPRHPLPTPPEQCWAALLRDRTLLAAPHERNSPTASLQNANSPCFCAVSLLFWVSVRSMQPVWVFFELDSLSIFGNLCWALAGTRHVLPTVHFGTCSSQKGMLFSKLQAQQKSETLLPVSLLAALPFLSHVSVQWFHLSQPESFRNLFHS